MDKPAFTGKIISKPQAVILHNKLVPVVFNHVGAGNGSILISSRSAGNTKEKGYNGEG
jgi:hypothetical protein